MAPTNEQTESLLNQKPAEPEKKEGEGDKPKPEAKPEDPPEKYEFKAPEGYELDAPVIEKVSGVFKELGLSQANADKLMALYTEQLQKHSQASLQAVKDMRAGWVTEAKALPGIGSELGPGGKVNVAVSRMIDQHLDAKTASAFRQAMDLTGAGDHPAFISAMYALAQKLGEGTAVRGNGPSAFGTNQPGGDRPSAAKAIYPNLN